MLIKTASQYVQLSSVDVLNDFLSGKSENTKKAYDQDIESFRQFIGTKTKNEAVKILLSNGNGYANSIVLKYKDYLQDENLNYSSNTINRKLYALKALVKTARLIGAISWDLEFQKLKTETMRDTKGPGLDTFKVMVSGIKTSNKPKDIRDYAMLRLFFDMGLRRSSIVSLNIEDVDLNENTIKIYLKGRREQRIKDIPEVTQKALENWLNIRYKDKGPLFINLDRNKTNKGKRISGSGVYKVIRQLSEKAGKRTRPHGLRHLAITEAIKETARRGMPLSEVTKFSDHASVSTLMIYNDGIEGIQGKISTWVSSLV